MGGIAAGIVAALIYAYILAYVPFAKLAAFAAMGFGAGVGATTSPR